MTSRPLYSNTTAGEAHRALFVPELVLGYTRLLAAWELVIAAQVCRAWADPAIDTLWRGSEVPLHALFWRLEAIGILELSNAHGDMWSLPEDGLLVGSVDMAGWMAVIDERFQKVTRLRVDSTLEGDAIELLQSLLLRYGDSLCSNLKSVHVALEQDHFIHPGFTLGLLLQPSLLDVTFADHAGSAELNSTCSALARVAPRIERPVVGDLTDALAELTDDWYDEGFIFDCGLFPQLRVVHLCDISTDAWDMLGRGCPLLVEVAITQSIRADGLGPDYNIGLGAEEEDRIVFPMLKTLVLECQALHGYVLASSAMPSLTALVTNDYEAGEDTATATFITEGSPNLTNFTVQCGCNLNTIQALCLLGCMEQLRVESADPECVNDDTITLVSTSLPYLQVFTITVYRHTGTGNKVTARGLLQLVGRCKFLTELELPLDLSECDDAETLPQVTPSTSITKLTVGRVVLPDAYGAVRAARFLRFWLPEVTALYHSNIDLESAGKAPSNILARQFDPIYRERYGPTIPILKTTGSTDLPQEV